MVMLSPTILFAPQQTLADLRRENKEREPHFVYCYAAVTRVGQLRTKRAGLCSQLSKNLICLLNIILDVLAGATHCGGAVQMCNQRPLL
jgi:hypothetical protein